MSALDVGSVVQLKSGGPALTVRAIAGDEVFVDWFDKGSDKSGSYLDKQLQPYEAGLPKVLIVPDDGSFGVPK